ncbi:MAG: 1-(5-phosphoribosyl)-5-((5-phosphoribosylamino)methylideneamino)imidazole-4-carboxamide isomerase [Spirochaetales bacterium]|nr:1-(5-phosphoribosyl)-5-((5-phosphoribosylamino)methylideneamino)imidazole-4-carboxamide isomerase [Spirochaetales bacterium]
MVVIPAIDIIEGRCVRLRRGDFADRAVYHADPVEQAVSFQRSGAVRIHLVDLDAARGSGNNRAVIAGLRKRVSAVLEVGGGIRTEDDVKELLDLGVDRLILGTVFVRDPDILSRWTDLYGRKFIAGLDACGGEAKTSGWTEGSGKSAEALALAAAEAGATAIIYTDIQRDGTLAGPDIEGTLGIARVSALPVILSGGIGFLEHLKAVYERRNEGIAGVITGKALYEGKLSLEEALQYCQDKEEEARIW